MYSWGMESRGMMLSGFAAAGLIASRQTDSKISTVNPATDCHLFTIIIKVYSKKVTLSVLR